ncbi:MAG: hypothetical protein HY784_08035 [Chloroflexi bacterium]|nr:hypothetical protein [Chloroflexota bacterium]
MTIDEPLLTQVDEIARLEKQHEEGYARQPVQQGEFDGWEDLQAWGQP